VKLTFHDAEITSALPENSADKQRAILNKDVNLIQVLKIGKSQILFGKMRSVFNLTARWPVFNVLYVKTPPFKTFSIFPLRHFRFRAMKKQSTSANFMTSFLLFAYTIYNALC